jgi:hypothetical protein
MIRQYVQKLEKNHNEMVGSRFGRLIVLHGYGDRDPSGKFKYLCVCDCGTFCKKTGSSMRNGSSSSCGCRYLESRSTVGLKHGMVNSPEYAPWKAMWKRCTNPNNNSYALYKDRAPPDAWHDFAVFRHDVGERPSMKHTLDRIDNDKPYGPGNCRWATHAEQARNKSNTIMVLYQGSVMPFITACELAGLDFQYMKCRKQQYNDVEKASNGLFKKAA